MHQHYMTRTVTVILDVDDDTHQRIANTIDAYATMYMAHVKWANTHNSVSTVKAHRDIYDQLRRDYPHVPSAIIQCARNNAFGSVKSFNTQNPKKKWTKNIQYRARSAKYDRRTVSLNTLGVLTFSLAGGKRGKAQVDVPKFFRDRYGNWEFNSATIGVNKKRQVFANLSYRKLPPQKKLSGDIVGADRGIYNIATTSNGHNFSSKKIRGRKRQFKYNRETLKAKVDAGSRSAKRRYNALKGKESRFNRNELHIITKQLAGDPAVQKYVLEDLNGLYQNKKKQSKKFKELKRTWSPALFEQLLTYKCEANGIEVVKVDPKNTSRKCSHCGFVHKNNRHGAHFHCLRCGYTAHADKNAADNIRDDYLRLLSTLPIDNDDGVRQGVCQSPDDAPTPCV